MSERYEGSHQQHDVICQANVLVPMADGTRLATDVYLPAAAEGKAVDGKFPVILERTPYNKASPGNVTKAKFFARRGYVCAIQDVRGRFKSEGEWYPFAKEAPDGYDTVEWLGTQPWSTGAVGTMGDSYAGSDQAALATLNPPHLATMIVAVGASNYYHSSMRQNGTLEQRFVVYAYRMAVNSREAEADPALKAALVNLFAGGMPDLVRQFPLREGSTILRRLPSYERWAIDLQTHGDYDDYWRQRGYAISEYYEEHADVPTLYLGGWYDSYPRNTCASYVALSRMKSSRQVLMIGPWTHAAYEVPYAGDLDFGTEAHINYNDLKLAWFDQYLKGLHTEVSDWSTVRIFTMGTGDGSRIVLGEPAVNPEYAARINHGGYWRDEPDWPLPDTEFTPYYLHGDGALSTEAPRDGVHPPSSYSFDPQDPVPTIGGGISAVDFLMRPGGFDQRGVTARLLRLQGHAAPQLPGRRPQLPDDDPGGGGGGYRANRDAPVGRIVGGGYRFHREADRRVPSQRRLPGRVGDQHQRLHYAGPIPQRLGVSGAIDPGRAVRVRLSALPHVERLQGGPPHTAGHKQQQLAPLRRQPQHRRASWPGAQVRGGPSDGLPRRRLPVTHCAADPKALGTLGGIPHDHGLRPPLSLRERGRG